MSNMACAFANMVHKQMGVVLQHLQIIMNVDSQSGVLEHKIVYTSRGE